MTAPRALLLDLVRAAVNDTPPAQPPAGDAPAMQPLADNTRVVQPSANNALSVQPPADGTDWAAVLDLAARQGVTALAWSGYERLYRAGRVTEPMPRTVKARWFGSAEAIRQRMRRQYARATEFAARLREAGVERLAVLKGMAYGQYYPEAELRESGDLDCFAIGDTHAADRAARRIGARVDDSDYKHSKIKYRGLTIENHHFLTGFNGTREGRRAERLLQELLTRGELVPIGDSALLRPTVDFDALFMLRHAQGHFLGEGIALRHLLDWHLLLERRQQELDWPYLYNIMERIRLRPFFDLVTAWCVERTGLRITDPRIRYSADRALLDRFEEDLFAPKPSAFNRHVWQKIPRIARRVGRMWRFRRLLNEPYLLKLWNIAAFSSYLHRHPTLD